MQSLTTSQRQYLRRIAHDLRPVVHVGKQGLTPNALSTIDQALAAHELIKIKFLDFQDEKHDLADQIAEQLRSELVGIVGNVVIMYRRQSDPDKRKVELPR